MLNPNLIDLLKAAASSYLGILALLVLILSSLSHKWFSRDPIKVRVLIFGMMFLGTFGFAMAMFAADRAVPKVTASEITARTPSTDAENKSAVWIVQQYTSSEQFGELKKWINGTCQPDSLDSIRALYGQAGRGGQYYMQIFCKKGHGALGGVEKDEFIYGDVLDTSKFVNEVLKDPVVIFLQYSGGKNGIYFLRKAAAPK